MCTDEDNNDSLRNDLCNQRFKPEKEETEGFQKGRILEIFQVPLNCLNDSNFEAFGRGPMAQATWAERPLRGSRWVLQYLSADVHTT